MPKYYAVGKEVHRYDIDAIISIRVATDNAAVLAYPGNILLLKRLRESRNSVKLVGAVSLVSTPACRPPEVLVLKHKSRFLGKCPTLYLVKGRAKPVLCGLNSTEPNLIHDGETTYRVG